MKEKLFILISIILISGFVSLNSLFAEDIKINKNTPEKSYKLLELKNNFLKTKTKKITDTAFKIESTQMSTSSAMLLGGGIGLVVGGVTGAIVGNVTSTGGSGLGKEYGTVVGAIAGGVLGLVLGGATGYILGN